MPTLRVSDYTDGTDVPMYLASVEGRNKISPHQFERSAVAVLKAPAALRRIGFAC